LIEVNVEKAWKRAEKQVARYFGAERTPLSGGNSRITRSDTTHPSLVIEVKRFAPDGKYANVERLFRETKGQAGVEHKTPVICLKQHGAPGFLIITHCNDYLDVAQAIVDVQMAKHNPEEVKDGTS
jgi:hypothetical protein